MGLEVAAFRIIGKTFGSALRETTAVIAVFLAAMSAGYWAGGRLGDRWPRALTLVGTLVAAAASLLFVPAIDAALSARIAASSAALATHAFLATTILFAVPAFLLAATSPIAIRLFATTTGESGSTAGSISALSTAGSIAGSIVTAFLLIDWLASIARTVTFVAMATLVTAIVVLAAQRTRPRFTFAAACVLLAVVLANAFIRSDAGAELSGPRPVFAGDSAYHHIVVTDRGPLRTLRFNAATQSSMRRSDPFGPGLPYTDSFHIGRLLRPQVRRVLLIGLGGGTAPRQFSQYYPDVTMDVVDVDPLVADVARRYFAVKTDERLRIHIADGRTFLKRTSDRWDLIIIDAYSTNRYGDTIPPHLVTREFFAEAATRLSEGGVLHFHCAYENSALVDALHRTLREVFPSVLRARGELLASPIPLIASSEAMQARAGESAAGRLPELSRYITELSADPPARGAIVLTDDYAPVDTLLGRR